ncbi:MAG: helix-turn-helix domain-containing protein [Brachybacterium sp.]|nr:helix-turn-helix domain-containing protein [Brachybacterium sp.]
MYSHEPSTAPAQPAEGTRERVLQLVLTQGPVSAAEIGRDLTLTAAAVRRHLDALESEGLVEVKLVAPSRGAGRPSRRYVVTEQAQEQLPDSHLDVATHALTRLAETGGAEEVRAIARASFADIEARVRRRYDAVAADQLDVQRRTEILTAVLEELGYASTLRHVGQGLAPTLRAAQVCQGHCPLQGIPGAFPEFCEEETALFARLLGVDVRRLSTLATGGHVCTTHVPLRGTHSAATRTTKIKRGF